MRHILLGIVTIPIIIFLSIHFKTKSHQEEIPENTAYIISGIVQPNETLETIFNKYNLNITELHDIYLSAKNEYNLSKIAVGNIYTFQVNKDDNTIQSMQYGIDDLSFLDIIRKPEGFNAKKLNLHLNKMIGYLNILVKENLIFSMPGTHNEYYRIALELSDIYAWDIDFSSDIRNDDSVKILLEELWVGEAFKGYGNILAAEFINNGTTHKAYRFNDNGYIDYYDSNGKSLRKTLLRSPLNFKYVSSGFSKRRLHPALRIYRPHLAIDYAAPTGTPVSAAGDGTVIFAGYKGQNGKMVRIKHRRGFETYYGHLSRIPRKIRKWVKVSQGDIIGYVGSTGLATGPHLDYRIKHNDRFVNPLTIQLPRGKSIPKKLMAEFRKVVDDFDLKIASFTQPVVAFNENEKNRVR